MNVAEILRKVAEVVDQADAAAGGEEVQAAPSTQLSQVDVDSTDNTDSEAMISPLQQEHELMKKATGVQNNVDTFAEEEVAHNDELDAMKRMAGIGDEQQGPVDHAVDCGAATLNPRANAALQHNGKEHRPQTTRRER